MFKQTGKGVDSDALHGASMMPMLDHAVTLDNWRDRKAIAAPGFLLLPLLQPRRISPASH